MKKILVIDIILLGLTLITTAISYGIVLRTSKRFRRGAIYLFIALIFLSIKWIIDIINILKPFITIKEDLFYILPIILFFMGLYEIKKAIKLANGEISTTKRIFKKKK